MRGGSVWVGVIVMAVGCGLIFFKNKIKNLPFTGGVVANSSMLFVVVVVAVKDGLM